MITDTSHKIRYYMDVDGNFWMGPINAEDGLHYAKLEGKDILGEDVWVLRKSKLDYAWDELSSCEVRMLRAI